MARLPNGIAIFTQHDYRNNLLTIWKSDGSESGTTPVTQLTTTTYDQPTWKSAHSFVVANDSIYFRIENNKGWFDIWKSDGTLNGTKKIYEVDQPEVIQSSLYPRTLFSVQSTTFVAAENQLFFILPNGSGDADLWTSDGTTEGTGIVAGVKLYQADIELIPIGNQIYFSALDADHGNEIWLSNGTAAGTKMIKDIKPGFASSSIELLGSVGDVLYFFADDGENVGLWRSDGTEEGTYFVAPTTGLVSTFTRSKQQQFYFVDRNVNTGDAHLVISNGTRAGTLTLKNYDFSTGSAPPIGWIESGDSIAYFKVTISEGKSQLWKTNGIIDGTQLVRTIDFADEYKVPNSHVVLGDQLYFLASDAEHGTELWTSDGTESGTVMVEDLYPGKENGVEAIFR